MFECILHHCCSVCDLAFSIKGVDNKNKESVGTKQCTRFSKCEDQQAIEQPK